MKKMSLPRLGVLLRNIRRIRVLVVGDVMLDRFIWGRVTRISPEAPVPVLDFDHESLMPGGAANVARNLTSLAAQASLFGVIGKDVQGSELRRLLMENAVGCEGFLALASRLTSTKTRIIAHQQQVVRVDRESCSELDAATTQRLANTVRKQLPGAHAVIVGDYGKGVVTQALLDGLRQECRQRAIWLSLDPKPVHQLSLHDLSLITPNRKEAFELAGRRDGNRKDNPMEDPPLLEVADHLLTKLRPALLLITLGDQGLLLCQRHKPPFHISTVAREVFDVSGAGDTVIASFTLAIAAGASPIEAAIFSNYAAGVVVGKVGTATVNPQELNASFRRHR